MLLMQLSLILLTTLTAAECYKILVYSNLYGYSHVKFMGAVIDTLVDAGHDVTVVMPVVEVTYQNRTAIKSSAKQIIIDVDNEVAEISAQSDSFRANLWTMEVSNPLLIWLNSGFVKQLFGKQCNKVMKSKALLDHLRNEHFDLAITESFDSCAYGIFEYLQVPAHVSVLSCARMDHVSYVLGQPIAPSYVPSTQSTYGDTMTMPQRLVNFIQFLSGNLIFSGVGDFEAENAKKLLGIKRSWREILPETSFLLTNHIPLLDFPAPVFDKIVPIGGISVNTDKKSLKLDHYFDTMISMRKKNVIISFGSNVKSADMPDEFKMSLAELFLLMPDVTFIWKYENLADRKHTCGILNINHEEWLPQQELLADPRVDAFITHGGLASVTELAMMGKPAVVIPIFADQARNAEMLKRHGGAEVLHKTDLANPKTLETALRKVMEDPSYRQNAQRLAEMLNNQPTNPKETLVKHVEFAARFGKLPLMDPYGRQQNIIEYYSLDILAIAVTILFLIIYTVLLVITVFVNFFCGKNKKKIE